MINSYEVLDNYISKVDSYISKEQGKRENIRTDYG